MKLVKVWNEDSYINCDYIISVNIETVFQKTEDGNYKVCVWSGASDDSYGCCTVYRAEDLKSCAFAVERLASYKGDGIINLQNMDNGKRNTKQLLE